jgi:hypothetical protein
MLHYNRTGLRDPINFIPRLLLLLLILIGLAGCNLGNDPAALTSGTTAATSGTTTTAVVFGGSVGDGPVTGATVQVYSNTGTLLGTQVTDSAAEFRVTVKARGNEYPLLLKVQDGVDLVTGTAPDFTLLSLLQKPFDKQANINPFTTLMVKVAERLPGGLTSTNVNQARTLVLDQLGFGLNTRVVADPFTVVVDNSNAAQLVKASEALGEWVRRTRDTSGRNAGSVLNALAADLTDGYLDGLGATGTDARITAIANVASAQVLVETLGNHLRVGGVEATAVMDQSLRSTHPGISNGQLTASVRVTGQLIAQARVALAAAQVLDNSDAVQTVASTVATLQPNSTSSSVSGVLPANSTNALRSAVLLAQSATGSEISAINQLVFASSDSGATSTTTGTTSSTTTTTSSTGSTSTTTGSTGTTSTASSSGSTTTSGSTAGSTPVPGALSLAWTAPATRSDGTPLSLADIGGYRIYYGTTRGSYGANQTVSNSTATSATLSNLVAGTTYYLVMTSYDVAGLESGYSPEVSKPAQ